MSGKGTGGPSTAAPPAAAPAPEAAAAAEPPAGTAAEQQAAAQPPAEQPGSSAIPSEQDENDDEEDPKETCGFCRFMKGGGCRSAFIAWSDCVDKERESGSDFTEECREKTLALRECMLKHEDYYRPLLEEEEEMMAEKEEAAMAATEAAPDAPAAQPVGEQPADGQTKDKQ